MTIINRRSLLRGAPVAAAAITMPAFADTGNVTSIEEPWDKARRLAKELSVTLDQCSDAKWMAHIMTASKGRGYPITFESLSAKSGERS